MGENTRKALRAFRQMHGFPPGERIDMQVWRAPTQGQSDPALVPYTITEEDVAGPFAETIPEDYKEKSQMKRLAYTSPLELLAEKFHMSQDLLRKLNPEADFGQAGREITVASVQRRAERTLASRIESASRSQMVTVYGKNDAVIAVYPATVGSKDRPSPVGEFEVTAVAEDPVYHYDPDLNLRNVDIQEKLEIPAGPNNPVGPSGSACQKGLWASWHAGARQGEQGRVARLRSADKLGCAGPRQACAQGNSRHHQRSQTAPHAGLSLRKQTMGATSAVSTF